MGNHNTRTNPVPKKLEKGMAVVVYIKPGSYITEMKKRLGIKAGQWIKGEIISTYEYESFYEIKIKCKTLLFDKDSTIIVRSTAYEHNAKSRMDKNNKLSCEKRKARLALAKVKPL